MNNINFANPWLLLIAIPLILLVIIPFIIAVRKDNKTNNNVISFMCHLLISILLTFAIAQTTFELVITETNIYVLADVSYSSNSNLDLIDEYIDNIAENSPKNSKIGIVCFGKDYELLVKPGDELKSVKESVVDNSATNLADALEYTATLFSDDVIKRIVIVSDGKETKQTNIVSVVQSLAADDIYIDAIYLDNNLKEDAKEVQINQIDYISSTYLNNEEKVNVLLQSNVSTKSYVTLYCNGISYKEKAVKLNKGYNTVSFDLNTTLAGTNKYKIVVSADDDTSSYNNTYLFNQEVAEKVKVLFISELQEDKEAFELFYGDTAEIDYFINKAEVPFTIEELCVYDEFILSNVDVRNLFNYTQFVSSIDTLVSEFGKSLVTLGNTYIQNNEDDETLSSLSDMLPIKYGNNEDEDKLITIVLDISRSMEQADRINIAKQAAYTILDNLDDDVMVMVVAFYGEPKFVILPTAASEREMIKEKIRLLEPMQGTFMGSALETAYHSIINQPYSKNEVLLISDGLPYGEQASAARATVTKMARANIILSAIHTITAEGKPLMESLASIGKGYYHFISDLRDVESLILNEVMNSLTETILEQNDSPVSILLPKDDLVEGVEELPAVKGLYNNTKKNSATIVLNATYTDIIGNNYDIPLYAYWNYGNGKVSSFSSSISGKWMNYWKDNSNSELVLKKILPLNKPSQRIESAFIITNESMGTITNITVDSPILSNDSILNISVTYPNGNVIDKQLVFDSQYYSTEFEADVVGEYFVILSYSLGELAYNVEYVFNISYLPEYNSFTLYEVSNLYYMVSSNGQISQDGDLKLENTNSIIQKYVIDFTPALMIACVVLFVIDVIVRKLRLQDIKSLFKKKEYFLNERSKTNEKKDI